MYCEYLGLVLGLGGQVLGLGFGGQVLGLGLGLGLGGQVLGLGLGGKGLGLGLDPSGLGLGICGLDSKSAHLRVPPEDVKLDGLLRCVMGDAPIRLSPRAIHFSKALVTLQSYDNRKIAKTLPDKKRDLRTVRANLHEVLIQCT